jgi:flagellar basal body-associated protein FliL
MKPAESNRTTFWVVIIIIGVLIAAAIALPSFLNTANSSLDMLNPML